MSGRHVTEPVGFRFTWIGPVRTWPAHHALPKPIYIQSRLRWEREWATWDLPSPRSTAHIVEFPYVDVQGKTWHARERDASAVRRLTISILYRAFDGYVHKLVPIPTITARWENISEILRLSVRRLIYNYIFLIFDVMDFDDNRNTLTV